MKDKSILAANFASQIVFFFRIICENNCVNKGVDEVLYNLTIMSGLGVCMCMKHAKWSGRGQVTCSITHSTSCSHLLANPKHVVTSG